MRIGVPKEIKNHEYRVGLVPACVRELVHHGHEVCMEAGAGAGIGLSDQDYIRAGARITDSVRLLFERSDMIVKVKEPQPNECRMLRSGQVLFTYLHLAPDPKQAELLLESGCIAVAYETVTDQAGGLPLLAPMSEVAGRMAAQAGAHCLEKSQGGRGVLLGGVPGVGPGRVLVVGGGVSGASAARMTVGMGADVTILEKSLPRIQQLDDLFQGRVRVEYSTKDALEKHLMISDLIICAVLIPGAAAPKLISREMLRAMPDGAVAVDIAIDQGGCLETSHPTTHAEPTFVEEGIVHYCVANMPGGVARTSTFALNNATLPYVLKLADKGYRAALSGESGFRAGLNIHKGRVTHKEVAAALECPYQPASEALGM